MATTEAEESVYETIVDAVQDKVNGDDAIYDTVIEKAETVNNNDEPPPLSEYKEDYIDEYEEVPSRKQSITATAPLASMADQVVNRVEELKNEEKISENGDSSAMTVNSEEPSEPSLGERTHQISLFIKAGSDRECIGCCPFSQRLFMMLWLKGVVFNVTTVDKATKPKQLQDIAPGANPPFLLFNMEELTDVQKCEDFIEAELYPPRYPKLACKHPASNTIGNDIFAKFSALSKFRGKVDDPKREVLANKLTTSLGKLNKYLQEPLDDEIDADDDDDEPQVSTRKFIDGNSMTIADCNMLPKLNIIRVVGAGMLNYSIPDSLEGIKRYLAAADEADEFKQTCPEDGEIIWTYGGRKPAFRRK